MYSIDARSAWLGDHTECKRLYRQFAGPFNGRFYAICSYYGWKRRAMLTALRSGRHDVTAKR